MSRKLASQAPESQSTQLVAELPGSAADYFIQSAADGRRALLYHIGHALTDPGAIYPRSERDRLVERRGDRGHEAELLERNDGGAATGRELAESEEMVRNADRRCAGQ